MLYAFIFQLTDCQKLETFRIIKHYLEDLMERKINVTFDSHPDFKAMILNPIVEWDKEATMAIEHGTDSLMDAFRLTDEDIQKSTENVKSDIERDQQMKNLERKR